MIAENTKHPEDRPESIRKKIDAYREAGAVEIPIPQWRQEDGSDRYGPAFTRVHQEGDWKGELNWFTDFENATLDAQAVAYYTGSEVYLIGTGANGTLRMYAPGYRFTIGA